jgi:ATP-binding cassette subfamily F protein uup
MSVLLSVHELKFAFAHRVLFEGLTFSVSSGEKIALIGQNGAGKSTLMKIIAGLMDPDSGSVTRGRGLKVGYLPQTPDLDENLSARDAVYQGVTSEEDWSGISAAEEAMSRLSIPVETRVSSLSGGWKKKVALARELARSPDVLLLDEPTNHLDVESILWLEDFVRESPLCVITISHDRAFLNRVARRTIEVDRRNPGGILSVEGNLDHFFGVKEEYLEAQAAREESLKNVLRREIEWLRRGAKARTTKQKARIERAEDLKVEVQDLGQKNRQGSVKLEFESSGRGPKKLIEMKAISKTYGDRSIFSDFSLLITPETRLGLMGKNGAGKSTLIRMIAGVEEADRGEIRRADRLEVLYFEQNRETLDPGISVLRTVCPSGETVEFQGRKMHVRSYLDRFLFSGGAVEVMVEKLSGGEQARLLLARMMLRPGNLLILDEPTNDLDLQTLDVLEDCLREFPGAVILVSHDRSFMSAVCDDILALPENVRFSDVFQWEGWFKREQKRAQDLARGKSHDSVVMQPKLERRRLSYKEQLEFDRMEETILEKETELGGLEAHSARPEIVSNSVELLKTTERMGELQAEIERLYARWAELEEKGGAKRS